MKKIILYMILGTSLLANTYFIYENNYMKKHIQYIEQENEKLKETPEIYWQKAIEKFNNKNYEETKEILNKLIEKFPTSSLVNNSQEKIKEINLIEKKKKEEEQRIIKSLPKQIANAKNAINAEKILDDLDSKYDDSYFELKQVIKNEREKVREKEAKRIIQSLPKKIKNSKSALDADKMLEDIRIKYGSYPGVQQAIGTERAKIREKIEREKEEQKYVDKAEQIIKAIRNKKFEIMNGDTTMYKVVINIVGNPLQTFTGSDYVMSYDILLYEQTVREGNLAYKQFHTIPFVIYVPIIDERQKLILKEAGIMNRNNQYEVLFDYQFGSLKICRYGKKYDSKRKRFI